MQDLESLSNLLDQAGMSLNSIIKNLDDEAHNGDLIVARHIDNQLRTQIAPKIAQLSALIGASKQAHTT